MHIVKRETIWQDSPANLDNITEYIRVSEPSLAFSEKNMGLTIWEALLLGKRIH